MNLLSKLWIFFQQVWTQKTFSAYFFKYNDGTRDMLLKPVELYNFIKKHIIEETNQNMSHSGRDPQVPTLPPRNFQDLYSLMQARTSTHANTHRSINFKCIDIL